MDSFCSFAHIFISLLVRGNPKSAEHKYKLKVYKVTHTHTWFYHDNNYLIWQLTVIMVMLYCRAFQLTVRKAILCGLPSQILPYIYWMNEMVKPEYIISQYLVQFMHCCEVKWSKFFRKSIRLPLFLLHAARLMTLLTGCSPRSTVGKPCCIGYHIRKIIHRAYRHFQIGTFSILVKGSRRTTQCAKYGRFLPYLAHWVIR